MRTLLVMPLSAKTLKGLALTALVVLGAIAATYFVFGLATAVVMALLIVYVIHAVIKAARS
ncbi:hypothetical protein [Crossiella sp. CA198]|uniref:hypothetical protein n=1 Tax=Crossiella sp. CA198 TaxID=3455607 RepID=UPI003F8D8E0B